MLRIFLTTDSTALNLYIMKLTTEQNTSFKPVSFTITCETQKELDWWASLFMHDAVDASFRNFCESDFVDSGPLKKLGADDLCVAQLKITKTK